MEDNITEAKRALVREDAVANADNYRGDRTADGIRCLLRANAHATLAVAIGVDRLLAHLEDNAGHERRFAT